MFRAAIVVAVLMGLSSAAGAQITTYIAPPKPAMTPQMVASADSARRDSVAAVAVTNMKAWVDSAAGITVPASVGDSTVDPGKPDLTTFSDGAIAPNTATSLPALSVFGVLVALAGLAMLVRRRETKPDASIPVASSKPRV